MKFSGRIFWLISLLLLALLTACGSPSATSAPTVTPVPTVTPTAQPIASFVPTTPTVTPPASGPTQLPQPSATPAAVPPTQPATGPGGRIYQHNAVGESIFGTVGEQYYLYEPSDPTPKTAPLIILLHGYGGVTPESYRPWINHLVKRGNLVIYPVYQVGAFDRGEAFTANSAKAIKDALQQLGNGKVKPDLDKVSYFGYSVGGVLAANLTAQLDTFGLPTPKALFLMTPGGAVGYGLGSGNFKLEVTGLKLEDAATLGKINSNIKMLVVTADRDQVVGNIAARFIWQSTSQIPASNKDYVIINSDLHGQPILLADHSTANRFPPNALSYFGMWKLFDALQSCALSNQECDTALGNTPAQRYMGKWSDGIPVKELTILKNP